MCNNIKWRPNKTAFRKSRNSSRRTSESLISSPLPNLWTLIWGIPSRGVAKNVAKVRKIGRPLLSKLLRNGRICPLPRRISTTKSQKLGSERRLPFKRNSRSSVARERSFLSMPAMLRRDTLNMPRNTRTPHLLRSTKWWEMTGSTFPRKKRLN